MLDSILVYRPLNFLTLNSAVEKFCGSVDRGLARSRFNLMVDSKRSILSSQKLHETANKNLELQAMSKYYEYFATGASYVVCFFDKKLASLFTLFRGKVWRSARRPLHDTRMWSQALNCGLPVCQATTDLLANEVCWE